jgi:hypothetical protein
MSKISVTTIDASKPAPKPFDYELTIKFPITTFGQPIDPFVAPALNDVLDDYRDGRRPFCVEQMEDGLNRCIENAVYQAIQRHMRMMYGDEMIPYDDGRGESARWHLEAGKAFAELKKSPAFPFVFNTGKATIERKP